MSIPSTKPSGCIEITEQWRYDKLTGALREKLSDAEIEKLTAEDAAWSEDQAEKKR